MTNTPATPEPTMTATTTPFAPTIPSLLLKLAAYCTLYATLPALVLGGLPAAGTCAVWTLALCGLSVATMRRSV
jgi:hypothetical protein